MRPWRSKIERTAENCPKPKKKKKGQQLSGFKKKHRVFQAEEIKMNIIQSLINMIKRKRKIIKANREKRRYAYG